MLESTPARLRFCSRQSTNSNTHRFAAWRCSHAARVFQLSQKLADFLAPKIVNVAVVENRSITHRFVSVATSSCGQLPAHSNISGSRPS
jgi:hypothetical protein